MILKNTSTNTVCFNKTFKKFLKLPYKLEPGETVSISQNFDLQLFYKNNLIVCNRQTEGFILNEINVFAVTIKLNDKFLTNNDLHYGYNQFALVLHLNKKYVTPFVLIYNFLHLKIILFINVCFNILRKI